MKNYFQVLVICALARNAKLERFLPIVYWHSAGESCCGDEFELYSTFIRSHLGEGIYIKSIKMDRVPGKDAWKSLTMHPFKQIKRACNTIQSDPNLANGFNAIGLSQGGLLLRGLAQLCPFPPIKNLISLAGPQNGVHHYPDCEKRFGTLCDSLQSTVNSVAYIWPMQSMVTPLTYWHDPNEEKYRRRSSFLANINNERDYNANYVINLNNLNRLVLVKYAEDEAIVPNSSPWFGYYDERGREFPLEETRLFQENRLGLQDLKEEGKLVFLLSPGGHIELVPAWFAQNILPYLVES